MLAEVRRLVSMKRVRRYLKIIRTYLPVIWRLVLRAVGLAGLIYLGVEREHPDPIMVIACLTMMGLPTAIDLDRERNGKGREK